MIGPQKIQLIAQLIESMEKSIDNLEKAYGDNDSEEFKKARDKIVDFQKKISGELT
jgi:hypothetical protein